MIMISRLINIRNIGKYVNAATGRSVNVKKGTRKGYDTDHIFYLYRGKRVYISESEFYNNWKVAD